MIVAEVKPFQEIKEMVKDFGKVLVVGCGSCVTVCMSGGEKQAELLAAALRMSARNEGRALEVREITILRQCDPEFIEQIQDETADYDALLSMACGAGVQGLTDKLKDKVILPAMNTRFMGMTVGKGEWTEVCTGCGDCVLALTGGICPVTTCPKGILNGPCGGNKKGMCEVSPDLPCAWVRIYEHLKALGRLDLMKRELGAKDWARKQRPGKYRVEEEETGKGS
ncbi:MAG: methylenetetrahydrofolate reductase C-terminal domain-containing protein [Nitrospirota bacterium]